MGQHTPDAGSDRVTPPFYEMTASEASYMSQATARQLEPGYVEPPTLAFKPRKTRNRRLSNALTHPLLIHFADVKVGKTADPEMDADSPSTDHPPQRIVQYEVRIN